MSALHVLRQLQVDVLLTDVLTPGPSGWELVRELRTKGRRPPRVASMSVMHVWEALPQSRTVGYHTHLAKLFQLDDLKAALQ